MSGYHENSIFWVETNKIQPNPFQPRREFEPRALEDLADSIRQYGILQPLVVTRNEVLRPDGNGMDVLYELIAGERRLRASKIAGLQQVPVIIRKETNNKVKLELAIIENLQREDLNPIDRALAFEQLHKEFKLTHVEIGKRMGKSRVYVSNTLRLLSLPEEIKQGLMARRISEGHTRPLLMLIDRPAEQTTLYKEIMVKKMSVRDAEKVARKIAQDKVRKKQFVVDPVIRDFEKKLAENLGTRVHIEPKEKGGQITIDYFTIKDLESILSSMQKVEREQSMMESFLTGQRNVAAEEKITKTTGVSFSTPVVAESQPITKSGASINLPEVHREELPAYTHRANSDLVVADKVLETRHNRINKLTTEKVHKDERKKTVTESLIEGTQVSGPKDSLESILEGLENNLISEKTRIDVVVEDIPKKIIEPVITEPTPMSEVNLEADQIPESSIEFHDSFKTTANSGEHILNTGGLVRESEPLVTQEESTDLSQSQPHYREESELASVPLQEEVYSAPIRGRAQEQRYIPQQEQGNENTQPYQTQNNGQHVQPQGQQQYVPQNQVHYQQAPTRKKSLFQRFFG